VEQRWKVTIRRPARAREIPYGPAGHTLPARFAAEVDYLARPLRVQIKASFDGENRVRAEQVSVERTSGESVTPEDMASLQLGALMAQVVWHATTHTDVGSVVQVGRQLPDGAGEEELLTVAQVYWFEYISWGSPRRRIMEMFDIPRSTANRWIRRARELYPLPGAHAEGKA
jgi:hypothetical protein